MSEIWNDWRGQIVDGQFHLREFLGGDDESAVFLAEYGEPAGQKFAIRLIAEPTQQAEHQLSLWERAGKLSHPHLIRMVRAGRWRMGDTDLVYAAMEYAEENLAEILPMRPLTAVEVREMLAPILDALAYLHGRGLVHGYLRPGSIMAVEDRLKISTDRICMAGKLTTVPRKGGVYDAPEIAAGVISPAADVWSLGVTLAEALTQHVPVRSGPENSILTPPVPAPFDELVRHCLENDVRRRWKVADIVAHLQPRAQSSGVPATPTAASGKWRYIAAAVAIAIVLAVVGVPRLLKRPENAPQSTAAQPAAAPERGQTGQSAGEQKPSAVPDTPKQPPAPARKESSAPKGRVRGEVIHRVLPEVPRSARATIRGKVRVGVTVNVDASGRVTGAKVTSPGPSRYFAGLALKSARQWRFSAAEADGRNVASEWLLRFEFGRGGTNVIPVRKSPR